jgi:hypothetical protein
MEIMMAKIVQTTVVRDPAGQPVAVQFVTPEGTIKVQFAQLTPEMLAEAAAHGIKQKVGDAAAIERDEATGKSATAKDKFDAMRAVADSIVEGVWNRRGGGDGVSDLIAALVEVTKQPMEAVRAFVEGMSEDERKAMFKDPSVAPVIATIKAKRAKSDVDTGALIAKLMPKQVAPAAKEGKKAA